LAAVQLRIGQASREMLQSTLGGGCRRSDAEDVLRSARARIRIVPRGVMNPRNRMMVVVFDIGNVLLRWNPRNLFRKEFAGDGDRIIVSGREGLVKPDPRIFELFLTRFELSAQEVFFIDDSIRNVSAARAVGMHAAELCSRGVLI
jgi:Haloacid dehalogenase-like hydrolase